MPGAEAVWVGQAGLLAAGDRPEQHQPVHQLRSARGGQAGGDSAPGVGQQRHSPSAARVDHVLKHLHHLLAAPSGPASTAQRRDTGRVAVLLGVTAGAPEADEVKRPYVKPNRSQLTGPGPPVERVGH